MKHLLSILILLGLMSLLHADVWVDSYTRGDGTRVEGHYRSSPNSTVTDNYSYYGNTNPYTGEVGTDKYKNDPSSPYYQGNYTSTINSILKSYGSSSVPWVNNDTPNINNLRLSLSNGHKIRKEIKGILDDKGYWFVNSDDSEIGFYTKRAIKIEQEINNLDVTGKLDMKTLELFQINLQK